MGRRIFSKKASDRPAKKSSQAALRCSNVWEAKLVGSLTEHEIKQIVLIKNKIFMFEKDKLDLFELICDLGGLLNELESVSELWKDDFQAKVNALEIIHDSIEDGSISRWRGNYRKDIHDAISKLKKNGVSHP